MKNILNRYLVLAFFAFAISLLNPSFAQVVPPTVMAQVQALLKSKGLNEEDVKTRLRSKGLDVDKMSQDELIKNKGAIEQTVNEMEAEKNKTQTSQAGAGAAPGGNSTQGSTPIAKPTTETVVIDNVPVEVSKKEIASEVLQANTVEPLKPTSIYGHQIFREKSLEVYRVSKDASPPDNYVLAPGDKINILIFGRSQADLSFEVNSAGFIQPSQMPKIFLSGLTLKQAKEMLIGRFSTYYVFDTGQFALTLNTSRTLTVNVFGEVEKAGSFTTSALNTALGTLASAGGPTEIGSVRNIQIIRGSTRKNLDVYAFMRDPAIQFDYYLQNNDILYIPTSEKLVTLEGAVKRPMRYELKGKEGLKELLEYAGGLQVDAYTELIQIQRIENNKVVLNDHNLNEVLSGKKNLNIENGDVVRIKSINSPLKAFVKATGAVLYTGNYELKATPSLKALLEKAQLKPEAKKDQAFVLRKKLDQTTEVIAVQLDDVLSGKQRDLVLQEEDELLVYDQARYVDQFKIAIVGEVRNPFERAFAYEKGLTIKEALELAGGLKTEALNSGYIYRTDPMNAKKTTYMPVVISSSSTEILKPGDKLVVLNKDNYILESSITITGDVRQPLNFRYDSSISIKDLVKLAGGLTISSDPQFAEIFRLGFKVGQAPVRELLKVDLNKDMLPAKGDFALQPFDVVVIRKTPDFGLQETISISGEVRKEGPFVLKSKSYHFSDLINDAGGFNQYADIYNASLVRYFDGKGVISFNAEEALQNKGNATKDPTLVAGDYVVVPRLDNIVTINPNGTNYVLAEKQSQINITFQGVASAKWYVQKFAGGFANRQDKKYFQVIRQNGMQEATKEWLFFRKHPKVRSGDKVFLSYKTKEQIEKTKREVKPLDWDKFLTQIMTLATTFALVQAYVK
jgi:protein involved in polysaccharide export with SLBB domain